MALVKNLKGQRFGKLLVVDEEGRCKRGKAIWKCKCDCGNETIVTSYSLKSGVTKSCGCFNAECVRDRRFLGYGVGAFNRVLLSYTNNARLKGLEFALSIDEFKELTKGCCFYCGVEPQQSIKNNIRTVNGNYVHNGIDRIDSSKGYISGNVVSCCVKCNKMKLDHSVEEFRKHIIKIYDYMVGCNINN